MHNESDTKLAFQPLQIQQQQQSQALQQLLIYLNERSPFYKKLFAENNVDISSIQTLHDLQRLPTTSKEDMQRYNWDFLCVPGNEIKEYTATSGTLGNPVTIALTQNDLDRLAYNECNSFSIAGGKPEDVYQLMLTLDRQFMAGIAYYKGIHKMGASLIRTGPGLPAMQWDTIERLQPDAIVAVPSFIIKLIEYAAANNIDLNNSSVKKAVCIGEGLRHADFSMNALAGKIKENWNIDLYNTYASTEMQTAFTECHAGKGGHEQPELIILEIIDEDGKQLKAGETGEICITTLGVEAMPVLRYRTGDMAAFYDEPCSCGRHSRRLGPVVGRKQQMIKLKGTTLYPPALFDMLNQLSIVKEYVVEVFQNEIGLDEVRLHILTEHPEEACAHELKQQLQSKIRVSPALQFHTQQSMQQLQFPPASRKQIKFIDNRK